MICKLNELKAKCSSLYHTSDFKLIPSRSTTSSMVLHAPLHPLNTHQLNPKHQRTLRRDVLRASIPVCQLGRYDEHPLVPNTHAREVLIPSFDDFAIAYCEGDRHTALIAGIEYKAVALQRAAVVDCDLVTDLGFAGTFCGMCFDDCDFRSEG